MKRWSILFIALLLAMPVAAVLGAYVFPSTNDANRIGGRQYVEQVFMGEGETTLRFVNPQAWWACFEYRTDGDTSQALATANPNPSIPDRYPHLCVNNNTVEQTFTADEYIEIRSVFGAERDDDFDWTRFDVIPVPPPVIPGTGPQSVESMPFTATDPAWFGAPVAIYWQWPDGSRDLLAESSVSLFGDISFVLSPGSHPANAGYGIWQTTDPAQPEVAVWGRLVAVVNGLDAQDVIIAACEDTACAPRSYIVAADLAHQALRPSSVWHWASQ